MGQDFPPLGHTALHCIIPEHPIRRPLVNLSPQPDRNPLRRSVDCHDPLRLRRFIATSFCIFLVTSFLVTGAPHAHAQFGGGPGGGGGLGGPGGGAPEAEARPSFRDHVNSFDDLGIHREKGDVLVASIQISGNQNIATNTIMQQLRTRKGRYYEYETVLSDVRRLNDMGSFDLVTFDTEPVTNDNGTPGMIVRFRVRERAMVSRVIMHGKRGVNERELLSRAGINAGDPLNEFAIEAGRRRLLDFYRDKGFNQVSVEHSVGLGDDPSVVIYRINEGDKERISEIKISGNTIVKSARLKKVISSRSSIAKVVSYINNTANLDTINADVDVLAQYYHDLGFLTATVGRTIQYDETGKWLTVHFVINEGPRYSINEIQIVGNQFITEESIRSRLTLQPGDDFNGTIHRRDVTEVSYGYGEQGFIYAEVEPQTILLDGENKVDLVYQVSEGDRWKAASIRVNIEGDPYLMKERTMLNMVDLREGSWINLRSLELNRARLVRSQLFETNPQVADAPDIQVVPLDSRGALR